MEGIEWFIVIFAGFWLFAMGIGIGGNLEEASSNAYDPLEELCDKAGYKFEDKDGFFGKYGKCWMLDDQGIITGECQSKKVEGSYALKCEIYVEERS